MSIDCSSYSDSICSICKKPFCYYGDIPDEGFKVGFEPYCVCGTTICKECGRRYIRTQKETE